MSDALRTAIQASIGAFGVVLTTIHLHHLLSMREPLIMLIEAGVPLILALGLVASVGWLRRRRFDRHETIRVAAWICIGVVGMILAMTWTLGHQLLGGQETHEVQHLAYLLANNVTGGAVVGVVLGSYDVRSRRREGAYQTIQRGVERERDRFATLFENVPNPTVHYEYVDGEPIVRAVNPAFTETFGYTLDDSEGRSVDDLIVPDSRLTEAEDLNDRLSAEDLQVEVTRQTKNGSREFLLYTVPLSDGAGHGFATYVDISDQKRREQRLQVLNRVLRHDLRNAMNVIIGHADNLLEAATADGPVSAPDERAVTGSEGMASDPNERTVADPDTTVSSPDDTVSVDDADVARCARAIRDRSEELLARSQKARAVESVLDLDSARRRTVDVAAVVEQHLAAAQETHGRFDASFQRPSEPVWAQANDLLGIAMDNLFENVAHHVEEPTVDVRIEAGEPVRITIRDNGPGIPESEIEVLNRGGETQLEHSSGLGLWLVTWIVRDTNGEITFRNRPDGAEVRIELPVADPPAEGEQLGAENSGQRDGDENSGQRDGDENSGQRDGAENSGQRDGDENSGQRDDGGNSG